MVVPGVWLNCRVGPLSSNKNIRNGQVQRCATLRQLIDAMVAHLFCHTYNKAKQVTAQNLGRGVSIGALREKVLKYAGWKGWNKKEGVGKKCESLSLKSKDQKALAKYNRIWTIERVQKFIKDVEAVCDRWRENVKESEFESVVACC